MKKFGEYGVHASMMDWLEDAGWETWGRPERNIWGSEKLDDKYDRDKDQVVYWEILKDKIVELNDRIDRSGAEEVLESLKRDLTTENLVEGNKKFYKILRNGKLYKLGPEYDNETIRVRLVAHPDDPEFDYRIEDNRFDAVTELPVKRLSRTGIRPDIVLFINGIPLVPIELKSQSQQTGVDDAISDMKEYEAAEPRLFTPGLFNAVCDGEKFQYAAVGAAEKFYFPWYSEFYTEGDYQPEDAVKSLFQPDKLMDIFRYFVFYESNNAKVVPRFMQYRSANLILDRVRKGRPRKGLIWHTQGSGKSYTMLFAAYKGKKSPRIKDRQYLLIVDRKKLDEQMADTLSDIDFPAYQVAERIDHLGKLLSEPKGQLILTTIHKFEDVNTEVRANLDLEAVVMADEAHRFMEKDLGNRLNATIPPKNNFYFGFTGTPVVEGESPEDRNTFREFSPEEDEGYLHRYSLREGERDGVIIPVTFTLKDLEWEIPDETAMDERFEQSFDDMDQEERHRVLRKYVNKTELSELQPRVEKLAEDIHSHYDSHLKPIGLKGMVVTPSKKAACRFGKELKRRMGDENVQVVISQAKSDDPEIQEHYISDDEERKVIKEFKDEEKNPKILVVCDKLLTGFDAPVLKTIYLDKEMKNHNLLQAVARTNRPREGKSNGQIVDYTGIFKNPEAILEYEDAEFVARAARSDDEIAEEFLEILDELIDFFSDLELDGRPETMRKCKVRLEKDPKLATKFKNKYGEAEEKYESISPHPKLGTEAVERKWSIVSQIYRKFTKTDEGRDPLGDEIRKKTHDILERHIKFGDVETTGNVEYDLPDREVKVVDDVPDEVNVVDEGGRIRRSLQSLESQNLVYSTLSERVKSIMEQWRSDDLSPSEALEEIEKIKEREEEIKQDKEERGLTDSEYALLQLIVNKYDDYVSEEKLAENLASRIYESVSDLSFDGNLPEVKRQIRREIIGILVEEDLAELAKGDEDDFMEDVTDYLVANEREER